MNAPQKFLAAAVQAEPAWFDLEKTLDKTDQLVAQAREAGVSLVAFPEVWLPGYPLFIWMGDEQWQAPLRQHYIDQSFELGSGAHRRLERIARTHRVAVVTGFSERLDGRIYMAQMVIGADGQTLMTRRKLKPSSLEGTFFTTGGPEDLKVVATEVGRVGALNCSEHRRPALRHIMYCQDEQLHVASWPALGMRPDAAAVKGLFSRVQNWPQYGVLPDVGSMTPASCVANTRSYAREGGIFVLMPSMVIGQAFHDSFGKTESLRAQVPVGGGETHIFDPSGNDAVPPLPHHQEGLLIAEVDYAKLRPTYDKDPLFERVAVADYAQARLAPSSSAAA